MENFTPYSALAGGALIGLSASLLLLANGRIAGISGVIERLVPPWRDRDIGWRCAFIIAMVAGALLYRGFDTAAGITFDMPAPAILLGGLLVGFGTATGGGCTSGHGICGIVRLSPRSIVATLVFMAAAMATVFVIRHGIGG